MFTEPIKELWNENFIYILKFNFNFIFGCAGSSLLCVGFLWLWQVGAILQWQFVGFSFWGLLIAGVLLSWSMRLYSVGSVVVVHGLSCSTACGIFPGIVWALISWIGRQILNHWTTRKVSELKKKKILFLYAINKQFYILSIAIR